LITSKDNPRVRRWAKLVRDARLRRAERRAIVEGPHLVSLVNPVALLVSESGRGRGLGGSGAILVSDKVFRAIVDVESPQGVAAEIEIPAPRPLDAPAVFLEGVQDPGNVGAILRSAAAFGVRSAVLDRACADPWSPKVLRAAMGAHFGLSILEAGDLAAPVGGFAGRVLCAVPRGGVDLRQADLSGPIGWLFGAEGPGVTERAKKLASQLVTIPMAAGAESVNVAAAAAICFHAAFSRPGAGS
jgi:TrmH family RNA methyltransferase